MFFNNLLQLKKKWEETKIEPEKDLLQDVDNQKDIIQKDKEFLNSLEEKNLEIKVKSDETLKRFNSLRYPTILDDRDSE